MLIPCLGIYAQVYGRGRSVQVVSILKRHRSGFAEARGSRRSRVCDQFRGCCSRFVNRSGSWSNWTLRRRVWTSSGGFSMSRGNVRSQLSIRNLASPFVLSTDPRARMYMSSGSKPASSIRSGMEDSRKTRVGCGVIVTRLLCRSTVTVCTPSRRVRASRTPFAQGSHSMPFARMPISLRPDVGSTVLFVPSVCFWC